MSLKQGGYVYTAVLRDLKRRTLEPIIRERFRLESVICTDSFPAYDKLDEAAFKHHPNVYSSAQSRGGIRRLWTPMLALPLSTGSESFWNRAKRRLSEYNGAPTCHFVLFLKECERPFNYGSPRALPATLSEWHPI